MALSIFRSTGSTCYSHHVNNNDDHNWYFMTQFSCLSNDSNKNVINQALLFRLQIVSNSNT